MSSAELNKLLARLTDAALVAPASQANELFGIAADLSRYIEHGSPVRATHPQPPPLAPPSPPGIQSLRRHSTLGVVPPALVVPQLPPVKTEVREDASRSPAVQAPGIESDQNLARLHSVPPRVEDLRSPSPVRPKHQPFKKPRPKKRRNPRYSSRTPDVSIISPSFVREWADAIGEAQTNRSRAPNAYGTDHRRPVCMGCRGRRGRCDMTGSCSQCRKKNACTYIACPEANECQNRTCIDMHPAQWNFRKPRYFLKLPDGTVTKQVAEVVVIDEDDT